MESKTTMLRVGNEEEEEEEDDDNDEFGGGIVNKIQEHFFKDDGFSEDIERWCITRCQEIDPNEDECRLEYTDVYKDFLRVFEEMITDVIEQQGSTIEIFYEELRAAPVDSEYDIFGQILNACADFDVFLQMMKETASKEQSKALESKSSGVDVIEKEANHK